MLRTVRHLNRFAATSYVRLTSTNELYKSMKHRARRSPEYLLSMVQGNVNISREGGTPVRYLAIFDTREFWRSLGHVFITLLVDYCDATALKRARVDVCVLRA